MFVSDTHTQWKLIDFQPDLFTVVFDSVVHRYQHNKFVICIQGLYCVDDNTYQADSHAVRSRFA
ncbi:hypothetical protein [Shigella phage 75/02 Stx]|uniref:Uncharacterized protein n=2 Tax=Diegovirus TaxID=1981158 RepID=V5UT51_9CAUD|nr:hypothetical protein PI30_gp24 [Shigella phage POCJ13]YP_009226855.1 hypothetical protein AXI88_gp23 [Shigella phage 75/02 Stx]AHB80161.1 hypothetical protein [Shigella phage 75/02 Stx]AHZ95190.1 hypothetical protein [Shigella phage POCJ13]